MALWKQKEDWTYEYFDLDEDVSTFIGAESFVELWNTKRGNRRVPRWSDYDWDDLFPWWGSLVVSDVFWEPYDYRYRLYGTNVVNKIGICSVPLSRHSYKGWRASSMRKFSMRSFIRQRARRRVVFPDPDAPMRAVMEFAGRLRVNP